MNTIASITTLILFVIYLVGRIITIIAIKPLFKDKIIVAPTDEVISNCNIINLVEDVGGNYSSDIISGIIVSREGIRNLCVYDCINETDDEGYFIKRIKGRLLFSQKFINIDEAIAIYIESGELFPNAIIEYETIDYMKIVIEWRDNLKSGVPSELVVPKHTIKSICYYLFR